jgi:hypothetical protein
MEEGIKFKQTLSSVLLLLGITIGIAFMSPSITGNAIGDLSVTNSTGIGIIIFVTAVSLGLILSRE